MDDVVALGSGIALGLLILFTDSKTDWTPQFLIVFGIVAAVCLGALLIGALERRSVRAHAERMAAVTRHPVRLEKPDGEA